MLSSQWLGRLVIDIIEKHWTNIDSKETANCFRQAALGPPVTAESLTELDLPRIINNARLRHEVNFDRELHFKPNVEGDPGERKRKSAETYWKALHAELLVYDVVLRAQREDRDTQMHAYWANIMLKAQRRLPKMFEAVRDILGTLVPEHEQESIRLYLDVELIMRKMTHGQCDLIRLSEWIVTVLKAHCASTRNEMVDQIKARIQEGARQNNHELLADGLRHLITGLEQMKLDFVNHYIRYMRPLLIDSTINFQRGYGSYCMNRGKVDPSCARDWLDNEMKFIKACNPRVEPNPLTVLVTLFLRDTILKWTAGLRLFTSTWRDFGRCGKTHMLGSTKNYVRKSSPTSTIIKKGSLSSSRALNTHCIVVSTPSSVRAGDSTIIGG